LLCGGRAFSKSCYAPTVLRYSLLAAKLSQLEVFGPMVCVYTSDALDEAIGRGSAAWGLIAEYLGISSA
jgi:acyl-CoA reductase-like NAD-dependent aldehyde dehydrogenase